MALFGLDMMKLQFGTIIINLVSDYSLIIKSNEDKTFELVNQYENVVIEKLGFRTKYKITLIEPSYELIDNLDLLNGEIIDVTPHTDKPDIKFKCYLTFFYDDSIPYRDRIFIEMESLDILNYIGNKDFFVEYVHPVNRTIGFNQNEPITITFSDSIDIQTVIPTNIMLRYSDGGIIGFTVTAFNRTVEFFLTGMLIANKMVDIIVTTAVKSAAGEYISQIFLSQFTTGGYEQLAINSVSPLDNEISVALDKDIEVEFNNDIDILTVSQNNIYLEHGFKLTTGYFDFSNDYVEIQNSISLNPVNITISFWMKIAYIDNQILISKNYSDDVCPYDIRIVDGKIVFGFFDTTWRTIESGVITVNTEYNVVCSYDGLKLRMFINKELESELSYTGSIPSNTNTLWIGKYPGGHTPAGNLGYIKIWNIGISNISEIKEIYRDLGIYQANLVMFLKFDETSGVDVADSSGNGNNGIAYNTMTGFFVTLRNVESVQCTRNLKAGDNKIIILSPNFYLSTDEEYRLTVTQNIRDISNGQLLSQFNSKFTTSSYSYGYLCGYYDGQNDYASSSAVFSGLIDTAQLSIIVKIKPLEFKAGAQIIALGNDYVISLNTGGYISLYSKGIKITETGGLSVGNIFFIAVSKVSTIHTLYIFNEFGILVSTANGVYSIGGAWSSGTLRIGAGEYYRGLLGFLSIYSTSKTQSQFYSIINGSQDEDFLERKYMHDDGTGTVLKDASENDVDAVLYNIDELSFWRNFSQ